MMHISQGNDNKNDEANLQFFANGNDIDNSKVQDEVSEYFFYTNNITLTTYLSLDSICANIFIDKASPENVFCSSIIDEGLLITADWLVDAGIIDGQQVEEYQYPIALKISLQNKVANSLQVILVNKDYSASIEPLSCFNREKHLAAFVFGHIPVSFITQIIFRTEEDRISFGDDYANIYYPEELYSVSIQPFAGSLKLDEEKISKTINDFIIRLGANVVERIIEQVKYRNKIKGILIGAFLGYKNDYGKVKLSFDGAVLDLLDLNRDKRKHLIESHLGQENKYIEETDYSSAQISVIENTDDTVFSLLDDCIKRAIGKPYNLAPDSLTGVNKDASLKMIDEAYLFSIMVNKFIEKPYLAKHQMDKIIDELIAEIKEFNLLNSNYKTISHYIDKLNFIKQKIITDLIKINDVLHGKTQHSRSSVLRAFMVFLKNSQHNSYDNLHNSLKSFSLSVYEQRLVWIIFGAANGFSAFGKMMKKNSYINRYADIFTFRYLFDQNLISNSNDMGFFKKFRKLDEGYHLTDAGFPLKIEIEISEEEKKAEQIREYFNKHATTKSKNKFKKSLEKAISREPHILKEYIQYRYDIPEEKVVTTRKKQRKRSIVLKDNIDNIKMDVTHILDIDRFIDELLSDRNKFYAKYRNSMSFWDRFFEEIKCNKKWR